MGGGEDFGLPTLVSGGEDLDLLPTAVSGGVFGAGGLFASYLISRGFTAGICPSDRGTTGRLLDIGLGADSNFGRGGACGSLCALLCVCWVSSGENGVGIIMRFCANLSSLSDILRDSVSSLILSSFQF